MKKLICLPLFALALCGLAGCDNGDGNEQYGGGGGKIDDVTPEKKEVIPEPETFCGYKRVFQPEEGKEYIMGMMQPNLLKMVFVNGVPHTDDKGVYPYYVGCEQYDYKATDVDPSKDALKFTVEYVEGSEELFYIKIVNGTGKQYEGKQYYKGYLHIYGDIKQNTSYTSLEFTENKDEQYSSKGSSGTKDSDCASQFRFAEKVDNQKVNAMVADFNNACSAKDYGKQPVAIGTWGEYANLEAITSNHVNEDELFAAHFWEKIEPAE